jgi:hypothetical protein
MSMKGPQSLARRTVGEWELNSSHDYAANYRSPFADVLVEAQFTSPSGQTLTQPGFYDGGNVWRFRFNPGEEGRWTIRARSRPYDHDLEGEAFFDVTEREARGFLKSTPGEAWGFRFESGEPLFLMGDTVYDAFGMDYCGGDVQGFLQRRVAQGFNMIRARVPMSHFHPPSADFGWQTRDMWAWGGSRSYPRFDLFNLDYFQSVDRTMQKIEALGLGVEMIMEGWGFEFPFNHRAWFTTEWEEIWMRYLIARYDAFNSVWFWTPLNEYEYYPNGDWNYKPVADRWAVRVARWIKATAAHRHLVSMHNGPRVPPFAERFRFDPEAVDCIMYQEWGSREREDGWLAAGIEESITRALEGWKGSAVFAEWGYERNPEFELKLPHHEFCDRDHTRRSAWRGTFAGRCIISGFDNSWGPWMALDQDQPGVADVTRVKRFFTEVVPFEKLKPRTDLVRGIFAPGTRPLVLTAPSNAVVSVYFPVGGSVEIEVGAADLRRAQWFDPRTGSLTEAKITIGGGTLKAAAPAETDSEGHPHDWILVARA